MEKIKNGINFIVSFIITYNTVAMVVCKDFFLEILPLALLRPITAFFIYVVGWQVSCFKKLNYVLKD